MKANETNHLVSADFLKFIQNSDNEVYVPATILWEIGAAIDHPGKTPKGSSLSKQFYLDFRYVNVDDKLWSRTWKPNLRQCVKAADRVFISCALDQQAVLVSWDSNLLNNAGAFGVKTYTPNNFPIR